MSRRARQALARVGVIGTALAVLVGCSTSSIMGGTAADPASKGGTLTLLSSAPIPTVDPQRVGDPATAALLGRTLHRTLTAYAPAAGGATQPELVGDLARSTGEPAPDLKSWRFTLRDGVSWQDGSPLTCEDVKHGIARTFATDVISGGSTDALAALAIPRAADGRSTYLGPWAAGDAAATGQAAFDQAVTCSGNTITFLLSEAVSDFNEMVTSLAFAPVKKEGDTSAAKGTSALSSGPYRLDGAWSDTAGGTLVRNEKWAADSDPVRKAFPDRIRIQTGEEGGVIAGAVLADVDPHKGSVSLTAAPTALQQQIASVEALRDRSMTAPTGVVDYLAPSVTGAVLGSADARAALAAATNRQGYAAGLATASAAKPTASILPSSLLARAAADVPVPEADPATSRKLLAKAGLTPPVPIKVAYRPGPAADKAMAALVAGWRAGGFEPTLVPIADSYFATISAAGATSQYDVFWSNWSPAWGSASTVLPPLFDSSFNLTSKGTGRDYGGWTNADWNAKLPTIAATADRSAREKAWAGADATLRADTAYIGLAERSSVHLAGSKVRGLVAHPFGGGAIDLAVAGVDS